MKGIIAIIIACTLTLLSISFYRAVQETVEVMKYVPHIMDTPQEIDLCGIDLSDTMVFHTKDTFKTKEKF